MSRETGGVKAVLPHRDVRGEMWSGSVSICQLHDAPLFQAHHGCDCSIENTVMARRVEVMEMHRVWGVFGPDRALRRTVEDGSLCLHDLAPDEYARVMTAREALDAMGEAAA